jgi:hypothetical protein
MEHRRSSAGFVVALIALPLLLLALYIGGYFALGQSIPSPWALYAPLYASRARIFSKQWLVRIYEPMAKVEGFFVGADIELFSRERMELQGP